MNPLCIPWLPASAEAVLLAALAAALWALLDLLSTFSDEVGDILRAGWAWIYLLVHAAGAAVLTPLVQPLLQGSGLAPWVQGLIVGFSLQGLLRLRLQILRPMGGQGEPLDLAPFEEVFSRFQSFCRQRLDRALVRRRLDILQRLSTCPEAVLLDFARVVIAAGQLEDPEEGLRRLRQRMDAFGEEQDRRLYLANFLLRRAGRHALQEWRRKKPCPATRS